MAIDWTNPLARVSKHFTIQEAIWLSKWGRLATAEDGLDSRVKCELEMFFNEDVERVRAFLGAPFIVHCSYRPKAYNELVGGAKDSAHMCEGDWAAIDFEPMLGFRKPSDNCDDARELLKPKLAAYGLRMEDNPHSAWVHIDNHPVKTTRFFKP